MACSISVGIYLAIAALTFILGSAANYEWGRFNVPHFWHSMVVSFAILQLFLLLILGMYHAGSAMQQEIAEKSIDFFRLLPLSPARKIVGVLIGRNLVALGLAVVNTAILALCGIVSGVDALLLVEFVVLSWVASAAAMLLAFLAATFEGRGRQSSGAVVVLLLSVFLLPYTIAIAVQWQEIFPKGAFVPFFGWRVHLFSFCTLFSLYACVWLVLGLIRRFANERATLFTPVGAGACLVGGLVIATGLGWSHLFGERAEAELAVAGGWLGTGLFTLLVVLGSLRGWDQYLESAGMTSARPGLNAANPSNLTLAVALILVWGVCALTMDILAGTVYPLSAIPVLVTFGFVLAALMEFSVTHAALTPRMHLLAGFAAGLYCILPLILAAITNSKFPLFFSPFGYVAQLGEPDAKIGAPVGLNLALLLVLGLLIRRRYLNVEDVATAAAKR